MFSEESRLHLQLHDDHMRFWELRGKHLFPAIIQPRHKGPLTAVTVIGAIDYLSDRVCINGTLKTNHYIYIALKPVVLFFI